MQGSPRRVLMFSAHQSTSFTGGRYHSWMMSEAIAALGWDITVVTTDEALVAREFAEYPDHSRINVVIDASYRGWVGADYDLIVLVPDLSPEARVFGAALRAAAQTGAPIVFLDFESPNWYNAKSGAHRSMWRTLWWRLAARHSSLVISSTDIGKVQAQAYYNPMGGAEFFATSRLRLMTLPYRERAIGPNGKRAPSASPEKPKAAATKGQMCSQKWRTGCLLVRS